MVRAAFSGSPWAVPALVGLLAANLLLAVLLARWRGLPFLKTAAAGSATAAILAITLTPSLDAGSGRTRFADFTPDLVGLADMSTINERSLNLLLFVPLGMATVLPNSIRRRLISIFVALLVAPTVEATQYAFASLGRSGFQLGDVIANSEGVVVGLLVGWAARHAGAVVTRRLRARSERLRRDQGHRGTPTRLPDAHARR